MLSKHDYRKLRPWIRGGKASFFVFSILLMISLRWIDISNYFSLNTIPTRTEIKVDKYYPYPNVYVCGTNKITRLTLSITNITTGQVDEGLVASLNPYIQPLTTSIIPNSEWNQTQLSELKKSGERVVTLRAEGPDSDKGGFLVGLYPEEIDWKVVPYSFPSPGKAWFSFQRIKKVFRDSRRDVVEYDYVCQSHAETQLTGNSTLKVLGEIHLYPRAFSKTTLVIKELNKINIINFFGNIGGYLTLFNLLFYLIWGGSRLRAEGLVQWFANKRRKIVKYGERFSVASRRPLSRPVTQTQSHSKGGPLKLGDSVMDREVAIEISRRLKIVEKTIAKNYIIGFRLEDDVKRIPKEKPQKC